MRRRVFHTGLGLDDSICGPSVRETDGGEKTRLCNHQRHDLLAWYRSGRTGDRKQPKEGVRRGEVGGPYSRWRYWGVRMLTGGLDGEVCVVAAGRVVPADQDGWSSSSPIRHS